MEQISGAKYLISHRLEAMKRLHQDMIECNVVDITGLQAELAEIDENLVRRNLNHIDEDDQLLRRKEIYEALHPETKRGTAGALSRWENATDAASVASSSFIVNTAQKMGVTPRTVSRKIKIAKNLIPEVKEVVKNNGITEESAEKLARLEPEQQKEAATLLADKKIKSVDEYIKPQT